MSNSDSEEDSCTVYWKTDSLLLAADHKHHLRGASLPTPVPLVAQTPVKPKRDTTSAHLPSPSTSAARTSRPLRLSKRRKPEPVVDPHPFDDKTLKTIGMLATRLSGRSSASSSLTSSYRETTPVPRVAKAAAKADAKGKGREVAAAPLAPHRSLPTTTRGAPVTALPRASTSEPTLHSTLATSKPFPSHSKPVRIVKAPPPEAPSDDDEFDEFDDASFELAASQLESLENLAPVRSSTKKAVLPPFGPAAAAGAPKTRLLHEQQNPTRSSPRFVQSGTSTTARPVLPPAPVLKPTEALSRKPAATTAAVVTRPQRPPPPQAAAARPSARPVRQSAVPAVARSPAVVGSVVVVCGNGAASAEAKREFEEAAAKEITSLCHGAEDWSDDDDF